MGKKMKKAATSGARYAVIIGEAEVKASTVMLKDLESGEQKSLPQNELPAIFARS